MPDRGENDFLETTKRALALRASYRCSITGCGRVTVGPSNESPSAVINAGEAAHICAASPGGRRYVESMTPEMRSHITNGIWVCSHHATVIDRDAATYTIELLHQIKRDHEAACAVRVRDAGREEVLAYDLVALGAGIICTGELVGADASTWSIKIGQFIDGDLSSLITFIDGFEKLSRADRYVLVNKLGEGRILLVAPAFKKDGDHYLVTCTVGAPSPHVDAQALGRDFSVEPKTNDLHRDKLGNIAVVSGVDALPQRIRSCLSTQRGESPFFGEYGVRTGYFFDAFRGSPWLAQMVKLEVIRQATVPYYDEKRKQDLTPLQCVERVRKVEALAETPENQWLPIRVDLDVCGVGRWQNELSIFIPSAETLAEIKRRQKTRSTQ